MYFEKDKVFEKCFNKYNIFKTQMLLFVYIKLIVKIKPTNNNNLIANKLI